jgi:hypothetical protein
MLIVVTPITLAWSLWYLGVFARYACSTNYLPIIVPVKYYNHLDSSGPIELLKFIIISNPRFGGFTIAYVGFKTLMRGWVRPQYRLVFVSWSLRILSGYSVWLISLAKSIAITIVWLWHLGGLKRASRELWFAIYICFTSNCDSYYRISRDLRLYKLDGRIEFNPNGDRALALIESSLVVSITSPTRHGNIVVHPGISLNPERLGSQIALQATHTPTDNMMGFRVGSISKRGSSLIVTNTIQHPNNLENILFHQLSTNISLDNTMAWERLMATAYRNRAFNVGFIRYEGRSRDESFQIEMASMIDNRDIIIEELTKRGLPPLDVRANRVLDLIGSARDTMPIWDFNFLRAETIINTEIQLRDCQQDEAFLLTMNAFNVRNIMNTELGL